MANREGFTTKYRAQEGPWPYEPAAKHVAYHLRALAKELTAKQRLSHETELAIWQGKATEIGTAGGCI